MSDHYHYEYADTRHDHRGEYAPDDHDHHYEYAEKHHRHYDDENLAAGLREDLGRAEARISDLENDLTAALGRIRDLEQQTPEARQAEYEADIALADSAESGYGNEPWRDTPADYQVASGSVDYDDEGDDLSPVACMRTIWVDGRPQQCGQPVDHEPTDECPGNPHARPAPEAGQS